MTATYSAQALQCVPYAREASGISIRGDAWTWWNAAAGQYDRGQTPKPGSVIVFKKFQSMRHGHVAVVESVVDSREVLVDHANWAPPHGHDRGRVAKMVAVRDVSPGNDWSEVRVWYAPTGDYGTRSYPVYGFIYSQELAAQAYKANQGANQGDGYKANQGDDGVSSQPLVVQVAAVSSSVPPARPAGPAQPGVADGDGVWDGDGVMARRSGAGHY